jgi:hypothetical protein
MVDPALAVQNRYFEPRVIGSVAGGPNNGFDLARRQIHSKWRRRLNTGWRKAMWWAYCGIEAALMRPLVDPAIPRAIENAFEI